MRHGQPADLTAGTVRIYDGAGMEANANSVEAFALAREALAKADTAQRAIDITTATFNERSTAIDRRFDSIELTLREQRAEAKEEHREQQEATAALADRQSAANAAVLSRIDKLTDGLSRLETAGANALEDRKMSTTLRVTLIGAATALGTGSIAAVATILGNH